MAVLNPSTDISTYIQAIYEDAWFTARETAFMSRLVTNFSETDEAKTRVSSGWSEATINTIGETDDLSSQAFTPSTDQTLTPYEYGAQIFLTDKRISADPFEVRNSAAYELGAEMGETINGLLLNSFDSFTGGTVGGAGTTITWGHVFAGLARLKHAKAPPPYYMVLHTFQWHQLAKAASIAASTQPTTGWITDEVMSRWYVGSAAGIDIFVTSDIDLQGGTAAYSGLYSPSALALDMRRAPRLEPERDASRRGWELNYTSVLAYGVWRPAFGITMHFAAGTPTS
jgi:hypothetical protein